MNVTQIHALWPEKKGFLVERETTNDEYIFLCYHSPIKILTNDGEVETSGPSFIINNKHSHQKFTVINEDLVHDWMHFTGNIDPVMEATNLSYNTVYEISDYDFVTKIIREIELEKLRNEMFSTAIIDNKIELLFLLLGRTVHSVEETPIDSVLSKKLLQVRSKIHRTYHSDWTVESMAKLVPLSPSRFYNLYKCFFGISPKKDLQNIRMEHATNLLSNKDFSVKEIAEKIGYKNEYYFIRRFKEYTGKTPGQYRHIF